MKIELIDSQQQIEDKKVYVSALSSRDRQQVAAQINQFLSIFDHDINSIPIARDANLSTFPLQVIIAAFVRVVEQRAHEAKEIELNDRGRNMIAGAVLRAIESLQSFEKLDMHRMNSAADLAWAFQNLLTRIQSVANDSINSAVTCSILAGIEKGKL